MRKIGDSVGQIGLDLVVNDKSFKKQMAGITNVAKKAGLTLAAAFSVKKIVDFGRECLDLGSDLAEVQNVVDVTFPTMTAQVDKFAKGAATSFGLSETMAKKFTGTFGAMAKAFGFSESAAYEMSTTLTKLSGDVASFYNISQDEAYTKLKSVFSGETETLKDLGIVMTQSALDAYALANGYGKTTSSMTELEKVSLRYAFVQNQLTAATGDFARTSDSWANQVRIMQLQMQSFMATVGQGLINIFTPVIKVINMVIGKLMTLANAFKAFTELVTGKKSAGAQVTGTGQAATESLSNAAGAADNLTSSTTGAGKAAKKAAKEMKSLMGFDSINKLDSNSDSDSDSGSTGTGGNAGGIDSNFGAGDVAIPVGDATEENSLYGKIKKTIQEIADIFTSGIKSGMGDWQSRLADVTKKAEGIRNSLKNIFSDPNVKKGIAGFAESVLYNMGVVVGSIGSIGLTIAQNLVGGIAGYLENNTGSIKQYMVNMFDIGSDIADLIGEFSESFAYVFEAFGSESGQQLTENLIGIFADAGMGITELCGNLAKDILNVLISPFAENTEGFRTALEGFLGTAAAVCATIKETIDQTFDKLLAVYDEHIKPFFDSIGTGLSDLTGQFLEFWNTNVQPVMDEMAQKFDSVMNEQIQPAIDVFIELLGSIAEALKELWENILQPLLAWIIEEILPVILPVIQNIYDAFADFCGYLAEAVSGIITVIKGIIDFVVGVFTGDWEKAWSGISDIVTGIMNVISSVIKGILSVIGSIVKAALNTISGIFKSVFSGISSFIKLIFSTIKNVISTLLGHIKDGICIVLGNIKNTWTSIWTSLKNVVVNIFNGIWSAIKGVINSILGGIESMANGVVNGINTCVDALNKLHFDVPDWVPVLGGKSFGFNLKHLGGVSIPRLAQGGYVKPNTPQLAMIGDNRHQGEVVAPEDKLLEMANKAAEMANTGKGTSEIIMLLTQILNVLRSFDFEIIMDGEKVTKKIVKVINDITLSTGACPVKV